VGSVRPNMSLELHTIVVTTSYQLCLRLTATSAATTRNMGGSGPRWQTRCVIRTAPHLHVLWQRTAPHPHVPWQPWQRCARLGQRSPPPSLPLSAPGSPSTPTTSTRRSLTCLRPFPRLQHLLQRPHLFLSLLSTRQIEFPLSGFSIPTLA
jgi:hypothetical protein